MSKHNTQNFYDSIASKYHWFFSSWDDVQKRQMQELIPLLKQNNVQTVLDCACGTGLQAIGLARAGFQVTGSDLSIKMLEIARENSKNDGIEHIELIQADFRELNQKVGSKFDAVLCMGNSIPHLMNDADLLDALKNIYGCLKHGGLAIFEMRNYDRMLAERRRFLPMRIHAEKDGKIVSVLYVFDYLENIIRFNIVYLIEDKASGEKNMEVEVVDYNPIRRETFLILLKSAGFVDISSKETGNVTYTAKRG